VRKSTTKGKKRKMAVMTLTPEILRAAAAYWGRKGGKSKSPAKLKALRKNAKLLGPRNKRLHELMDEHKCSRQWAYELLRRENLAP
jgi:hypothetical protein